MDATCKGHSHCTGELNRQVLARLLEVLLDKSETQRNSSGPTSTDEDSEHTDEDFYQLSLRRPLKSPEFFNEH